MAGTLWVYYLVLGQKQMPLSDMNADCCCCYIFWVFVDGNPQQGHMKAWQRCCEFTAFSSNQSCNQSLTPPVPLYLSCTFNQVLSGFLETQAKTVGEEWAKERGGVCVCMYPRSEKNDLSWITQREGMATLSFHFLTSQQSQGNFLN